MEALFPSSIPHPLHSSLPGCSIVFFKVSFCPACLHQLTYRCGRKRLITNHRGGFLHPVTQEITGSWKLCARCQDEEQTFPVILQRHPLVLAEEQTDFLLPYSVTLGYWLRAPSLNFPQDPSPPHQLGPVVMWDLSTLTRDQTHVPHIARQIPNL